MPAWAFLCLYFLTFCLSQLFRINFGFQYVIAKEYTFSLKESFREVFMSGWVKVWENVIGLGGIFTNYESLEEVQKARRNRSMTNII